MADLHHNRTDGTPISLPEEQPLLQQQESEKFHHQQNDDDMKGHDSGDDYSSGSDRSIEIDDTEEGRGDSGSGGGANEDNANCPGRRRRKKRHGSHGSRRHKGGSRHKHRSSFQFQPYPGKDELSSTLKRKSLELQEKENAAAVLRREEGQDQPVTFPVAPFNSTQFLMDEHSKGSPKNLNRSDSNLKLSAQDTTELSSVPSTPKHDGSENLATLFHKDKEFADIYSSIHAENLQSMPKEELVKHYMSLEEQIAALQKKVAAVQQQKVCDVDGTMKLEMDKDSVAGSDTNSLSSANEEYVDLNLTFVNPPTIVVGIQSVEDELQTST